MTTRQVPSSGIEPERGLVLAVLPRSADAALELDELRELARTAGVEPVGELEELKHAYAYARAEVLLVDD